MMETMPIFSLLLVSFLIFDHRCGLFLGANVWNGDKGHFVSLSVTARVLYFLCTTLFHLFMLHTASHSFSLSPLKASLVLQEKTGTN